MFFISSLQSWGGDHLCTVVAYHMVWPRALRLQAHPETLRFFPVVPPVDAHLPRRHGKEPQEPTPHVAGMLKSRLPALLRPGVETILPSPPTPPPPFRSCCTERRRWSRASVTWPWSTTSCLEFPRTCRMNCWYRRHRTCLTGTRLRFWPREQLCSRTRGKWTRKKLKLVEAQTANEYLKWLNTRLLLCC